MIVTPDENNIEETIQHTTQGCEIVRSMMLLSRVAKPNINPGRMNGIDKVRKLIKPLNVVGIERVQSRMNE